MVTGLRSSPVVAPLGPRGGDLAGQRCGQRGAASQIVHAGVAGGDGAAGQQVDVGPAAAPDDQAGLPAVGGG